MFDFVEDELGDGFNNDADVLSLSPLSIEKYLTSAQFLIDKALDPAPANAAVRNTIMVCTRPADARGRLRPAHRRRLRQAGLPPAGAAPRT